jgi:hypothetical protein
MAPEGSTMSDPFVESMKTENEKWDGKAMSEREEIGRDIYLAQYAAHGGRWEANESKEVWYAIADRFIALRAGSAATPPTQQVPEGATHMRRPEYLTAWLFDVTQRWPTWLVEKYTNSTSVPDTKIGHYATAVDGEFWRWFDPAKFNELFVEVSPASRPNRNGAT